MLAFKETLDKSSCLNRALDNEMVFVLLGRDEAAPFAIRVWAEERIRLGKNGRQDAQIVEALAAAGKMDEDREYIRGLAMELGKNQVDWLHPGEPRCTSMHGGQQCQFKVGHSGPHQECNEVWNHE